MREEEDVKSDGFERDEEALEVALNVIDQICGAFQGNREQHIQIQQCYEVVKQHAISR